MRFSLRRSRLGAASDKLLKVGGDLVNEGLQSPRRRTVGEQPSADLALDLVDCQGSVDLPWRIGVQMRVGGDVSRQGIEVVEDGLGTEVLIGRLPGQAGGMFESQAMLEPAKEVGDILPNNTRQPKS